MRLRSALTYLLVCFAGCTCESEHRELATLDEPPALLEADYEKELGCGAAGGHGFGIIFPTVDRDYNQRLTVESGPLTGVYRAPDRCACEGDSAELDVNADRRTALVGCDDATWHVYYLVPGYPEQLHCLQDAFDARPDWSQVPVFSDGIVKIMGGRFIPDFVADVAKLDGDEAAASVLAQMVAVSGSDWVETLETLSPDVQTRPRQALRDALAQDEVPRAALDRAYALGAADRELVKSAVVRYVEAGDGASATNLRPYHYDPARRALARLGESRVDDLRDVTCTLMSAKKCDKACVGVLAQTDWSCEGLEEYLSWQACVGGDAICEGDCAEEPLTRMLDDPTHLAPRRAAIHARLAALKRPELGNDLLKQWDRARFEVDRSIIGCDPAREPCPCAHDDTLQRAACREPLSEQTFEYAARCQISIDDVAGTLVLRAVDDGTNGANPDAGVTGEVGVEHDI